MYSTPGLAFRPPIVSLEYTIGDTDQDSPDLNYVRTRHRTTTAAPAAGTLRATADYGFGRRVPRTVPPEPLTPRR